MHGGEIASVAFFSIFVAWVIAHYCYLAARGWYEISLKRDMVARGYTAQEIVQVVAARKGSRAKETSDVPPAKPLKQSTYAAN